MKHLIKVISILIWQLTNTLNTISKFQGFGDQKITWQGNFDFIPFHFSRRRSQLHEDKNFMIYADDFVWLHFPKCAGTKIERLFKTYYSSDKRIFQDTVDPKIDPQATWHDSVSDREKRNPHFTLGKRIIICSFRRLPSWLESRYSFEVQRSPELNHRPELLLEGKFLEHGGYQNH